MVNRYIMDNTAIQFMLETLPRKVTSDLWNNFENQCDNGIIVSDRETKKILEMELAEASSVLWLNKHSEMFIQISQKEADRLGGLVVSGVFSFLENSPYMTRKLPIGTPFIVVIALEQDRSIVLHKSCKDLRRIKHICSKLGLKDCLEIEDYLVQQKMT